MLLKIVLIDKIILVLFNLELVDYLCWDLLLLSYYNIKPVNEIDSSQNNHSYRYDTIFYK